MKQLLLLCCGAWLTLAIPVRAAWAFVNPPDSLAGEARLTKLVTQGICEQVALESRHQDLTVLTRSQGMVLLEAILTRVITQYASEFAAFAAAAPDAEAAGQRVSMQAVLQLSRACPSASQLLTQLGIQMAGLDTKLSSGQQQALEAVAQDMCGLLAAEDSQKALSSRTAPERMAIYQQVQHQAILAHGQDLVAAFGEQLLTNEQLESSMWKNIDRVMFERCPAITGLRRVDFGSAKQRDQPEPAPAPESKAAAQPGRRNRK